MYLSPSCPSSFLGLEFFLVVKVSVLLLPQVISPSHFKRIRITQVLLPLLLFLHIHLLSLLFHHCFSPLVEHNKVLRCRRLILAVVKYLNESYDKRSRGGERDDMSKD